jgi:hypothetical protein
MVSSLSIELDCHSRLLVFFTAGIVYGQGAYFSANAKYSHGYTRIGSESNERCMFIVNVLVGKTCRGDKNMKTPATGYDSTTDGDHIFVTYRDDQAYATHLIVYH